MYSPCLSLSRVRTRTPFYISIDHLCHIQRIERQHGVVGRTTTKVPNTTLAQKLPHCARQCRLYSLTPNFLHSRIRCKPLITSTSSPLRERRDHFEAVIYTHRPKQCRLHFLRRYSELPRHHHYDGLPYPSQQKIASLGLVMTGNFR